MNIPGFSLLETIMYIALFGVLMSGALVAVYQLVASGEANLHKVAIQEEGLFINRKISWALSGATAVVAPDAKTLVITRPDLGAQSPLTFREQSGVLQLARAGSAPLSLTTAQLVVSSTTVTVVPAQAGVPSSVRVMYRIDGVPFTILMYLRNI